MRGVDVRTSPYERVQTSSHEWAKLRDVYVINVLQNGLRFGWVLSFDPDDPVDDYQTFTTLPIWQVMFRRQSCSRIRGREVGYRGW